VSFNEYEERIEEPFEIRIEIGSLNGWIIVRINVVLHKKRLKNDLFVKF